MNTSPTPEQLQAAKAAYTRYGQVTDFKNFRGDPMPEFEQLPEKIQQAWVAVVEPLCVIHEAARKTGCCAVDYWHVPLAPGKGHVVAVNAVPIERCPACGDFRFGECTCE